MNIYERVLKPDVVSHSEELIQCIVILAAVKKISK
jgi:hypothetical protein